MKKKTIFQLANEIEDIRLSGKYNMITDAKEITKELNIDLKYYLSILLNLENYLEVK